MATYKTPKRITAPGLTGKQADYLNTLAQSAAKYHEVASRVSTDITMTLQDMEPGSHTWPGAPSGEDVAFMMRHGAQMEMLIDLRLAIFDYPNPTIKVAVLLEAALASRVNNMAHFYSEEN